MNKSEASIRVAAWRKLSQGVVVFILHQFVGSLGIVIFAAYFTAYIFDVLQLIGKPFPSKSMYWILTGTPYYPVQFGLGLFLGWLISRRVHHRAMLWIWVLPFAYLTYALIAIPTLVPQWIPAEYQAGVGESRFKHYFGWGCGTVHPCFDQAAITLPFYAAAAYSIGALLARKVPKRSRPASRWEFRAFSTTGIIFLLISVLEFVRVTQQGWRSIYLGLVAMPAAIGVFLILYAITLRQQLLLGDAGNDPPAQHNID